MNMDIKESREDRIARLTAEATAASKAKPAPRVKAKPTATDVPFTEDVHVADTDTFMAAMRSRFGDFKMPTGRRMITSIIVQLLVAVGIGYLTGILIGYALIGAAMLSTAAWMHWVIYILGTLVGLYIGGKACARVGRYIALGEIDHDFGRARNWVTGFFGKKDEVAHA